MQITAIPFAFGRFQVYDRPLSATARARPGVRQPRCRGPVPVCCTSVSWASWIPPWAASFATRNWRHVGTRLPSAALNWPVPLYSTSRPPRPSNRPTPHWRPNANRRSKSRTMPAPDGSRRSARRSAPQTNANAPRPKIRYVLGSVGRSLLKRPSRCSTSAVQLSTQSPLLR